MCLSSSSQELAFPGALKRSRGNSFRKTESAYSDSERQFPKSLYPTRCTLVTPRICHFPEPGRAGTVPPITGASRGNVQLFSAPNYILSPKVIPPASAPRATHSTRDKATVSLGTLRSIDPGLELQRQSQTKGRRISTEWKPASIGPQS